MNKIEPQAWKQGTDRDQREVGRAGNKEERRGRAWLKNKYK